MIVGNNLKIEQPPGQGGRLVNRLFNQATMYAALTNSLILSRGTGSPTYTGGVATGSSIIDNEGILRFRGANEAGFVGARRVKNTITTTSENFDNAAWTKATGGGGSIPVVTADQDPNPVNGVAFADKIVFVAPVSGDQSFLSSPVLGIATGRTAITSFYIKAFAAGDVGKVMVFRHVAATGYTTVTLTDSYQRISNAAVSGGPSTTLDLGLRPAVGSSTGTVSVYLAAAMCEDITGRTDQTTPSEYVSVGVLSAPYHGLGVDGVKDFPTTLAGAPLPTATTYDSVTLNGVAGTYVSTPNAAANQITGDIDIRVKAALADWTPVNDEAFVAKWGGAGNRAYQFRLDGTVNLLRLIISTDGTAQSIPAVATAALTVSDGQTLWCRVTRNSATGDTTFYTSSDGAAWTQLGAVVATAAGASFASTAIVECGTADLGALRNLNGKIYQAQIYNGINGTLAVDFNASRYKGGTTLTGSTGEVYTLNGSAYIQPTNFPMLGYQAELAAENRILQSNDFAATWLSAGTSTMVKNAIGPDGATSAWTFTDTDATYSSIYYQDETILNDNLIHTTSVFVKKTTAATTFPGIGYVLLGGVLQGIAGALNTDSGVFTTQAGYPVGTGSVVVSSYNTNYWRVAIAVTNNTSGNVAARTQLLASVNTNAGATWAVSTQGSAVFYGVQDELGSVATSYIPTTTVSVTRAADVLTYPSAGNILAAGGFSSYKEVTMNGAYSNNPVLLQIDDGTDNNRTTEYFDGSRNIRTFTVTGGALQAGEIIPNVVTNTGVTFKTANVAFTNDFRFVVNGTAGTPDTSGTTPVVTTIRVGNGLGAAVVTGGTIRNVRLWQRALSNSELQAITTT